MPKLTDATSFMTNAAKQNGARKQIQSSIEVALFGAILGIGFAIARYQFAVVSHSVFIGFAIFAAVALVWGIGDVIYTRYKLDDLKHDQKFDDARSNHSERAQAAFKNAGLRPPMTPQQRQQVGAAASRGLAAALAASPVATTKLVHPESIPHANLMAQVAAQHAAAQQPSDTRPGVEETKASASPSSTSTEQ